MSPLPKRCAIYTRKSSEEGLEQEFNSLDAQREACEAFVQSQKHEGWCALPDRFDDGGYSGGTADRPALQRLLHEVRERQVDIIVVYKVDRLTRSLADFSKLVETLDSHGASFVSVTQQFNTSTSMGRLTLNVLLSFAQFEREVTGERIRDKLAATAKKGMRLGGVVPLGYDLNGREMVINPDEAQQVRHVFRRYLALKCVSKLKSELDAAGQRSKVRTSKKGTRSGGQSFTRGALYRILQNRTYLGEIVHKGTSYPGRHDQIVAPDLWQQVHDLLSANRASVTTGARAKDPSLLAGLIFDDRGNALSPSHAVKNGKRYRYYVNQAVLQFRQADAGAVRRISAPEVEQLVVGWLRKLLSDVRDVADLLGISPVERDTLRNLQVGSGTLIAAWDDLSPSDLKALVRRTISKVTVDAAKVVLDVSRLGLAEVTETPATCLSSQDTMMVSLDAQFRRVGSETRLILEGSVDDRPVAETNPILIRALAQGHQWSEAYRRDPTLPMTYFARQAGISETYATRILKLGLLAPDIVEAIVAGQQPKSLTLKKILRGVPLLWQDQRNRFGFPRR